MHAMLTSMIVPTKIGSFYEDTMQWYMIQIMNFIVIAMWLPLMYRTTFRIVSEKQSQAKATMRVMGLSMLPYWLSWFLTYTLLSTTVCALTWLVLTPAIVTRSSSAAFLLVIWLNAEFLFGKILIVQALFSDPRNAGIACSIFFLFVNIFYVVMLSAGWEVKWRLCFWDP
jgi:hypothetical protein